ncbi:MAG: hypothetical protein QY332_07330 [Anaerolineales bacterium]|nr:MAG: hypothetical protein QY332_07330 [Anaerolineales bacterium]
MNKKSLNQARQRSIHVYMKQQLSQSEGKRPLESVREIIGLATASASIFVALLYLAGRRFASGYFEAMNIPNYQVNFSVSEYGEVAWLPMLIYPAIILGSAALIGVIFSALQDWATPQIKHIVEWLGNSFEKKNSTPFRTGFSKQTKQWLVNILISIIVILSTLIIDSTLYFVYKWGELSGLINVVNNSAQIDLVSISPLHLLNEDASNQSFRLYKDYQMLTFNENKYYVFDDIDPATCKPLQVYVIDSPNLIQVNIKQPISLESKCSKKIPVGLFPTIEYLFTK